MSQETPNALEKYLIRANCTTCGNRIALVDTDKKGRRGQWVHVTLPASVHSATPGDSKIDLNTG